MDRYRRVRRTCDDCGKEHIASGIDAYENNKMCPSCGSTNVRTHESEMVFVQGSFSDRRQ